MQHVLPHDIDTMSTTSSTSTLATPPLRTSRSSLSLAAPGYIRTPVHSPAPLRRTRSASPCHWDPTSDDDEPQSPLAKVGNGIA